MFFNGLWIRLVPFGLMFSLGLLATTLSYCINFADFFRLETKDVPKIISSTNNDGGSSGGTAHEQCYTAKGKRCFPDNFSNSLTSNAKGVKIISKPRADYTEEARLHQVQGNVVLRVVFKADGTIGAISIISGLPNGLTKQAIEAAKQIKFEPAKLKGKPYSITKNVEYSFWIY